MGLIDLKTNLKSLKYGNDQKGGGSSNQPYIVAPIPDGFSETAPDFLLRNGYLNPLSSIQDVSRLTKMFLDTKSPNGLLFITKQELLERQNVVVQNGFDRIYNPLNTLAQAGVISTGYHLNKQGLNPFAQGYFNGGRNGYYQTTLDNSNGFEEGKDNRLYALYKIKQSNSGLDNAFLKDKYEISSNPTLLLSYSGGPNSVLGFGKTNIRIQNPTQTVINQNEVTKAYKSSQVNKVGYLTPTGPFTINWSYDPTIAGNNGVTKQYLEEILKSDGDFGDLLNNNMLNRDTSTVIPIGKPENTFVKSQDSLKTSPNYLRTGPIKPGSVTWVYRPIPTGTTNKDLYQQLLTNTIGGFIPFTEPQSVQVSKQVLNRTGLEGKDEKTIYPSSSIISRGSYYKTKNTNALISSIRPDLLSSITFRPEGDVTLDNEILNNISQNIPNVPEVPDDIVEGKQKITTLSSLNPQYFTLNKDKGTITSSKSIPEIGIFNREDKYGTGITTWNNKDNRSKGVNNLDITTYSDNQNVKNILQGSRNNQIEQANSDLIKFFFEINNNNGATNTQNWFLFFRAYLNDLGDSYKADWQSYKYVGRAENFYKYGGFSRDISLGFTIYAHSRAEMAPIYDKLNYLVGVTAPDYSKPGYMRGNFVNLTVGDYLNNVPGIITDINLKPSFEAGWDINRKENGNIIDSIDSSIYVGQLPKLIEISMTFTPIHSFTPQFGEAFIRNTTPLQKPTTNTQQPTQDGVAENVQ